MIRNVRSTPTTTPYVTRRANALLSFHPMSRGSGVRSSVMQRNRSVQTPVWLVRALSGCPLRLPVGGAHTSHAKGARLARNTTGFKTKRTVRSDRRKLEVLPEIHPRIQARHPIAVAVEHHRLAHEELADAPLLRLAPARMIDRGV